MKTFLTIILAVVLLVHAAQAAIIPDTGNVTGYSNSSYWTLTHTCGGSTDNYLVVGIAFAGASISSMLINGEEQATIKRAGTGETAIIFGKALGTSTAENSISITFATNQSGSIGAVCLSGVNQTTPYGTVAGSYGTSVQASTVVNPSATGELIIFELAWSYGAGYQISGTSGTLLYSASDGNFVLAGYGYSEPGASTVTPTVSFNINENWALAAVSFKPASGGPVNVVRHFRIQP